MIFTVSRIVSLLSPLRNLIMRMNRILMTLALAAFLILGMKGESVDAQQGVAVMAGKPGWKQILADSMPAYGHRNWIVIADSAYPSQTAPGIQTVVTDASQLEVIKAVLTALDGAKNLRPIIHLDEELAFVPDADAPGASKFREELAKLMEKRSAKGSPHEEIIAKLDAAGQKFKVLVLKTDFTVPYSSVFIELGCGYWNAEAEQRLREAIKTKK